MAAAGFANESNIDNRLELMINQQRAEKIPLIHDQDKNKIKNLAFAGFSFIHLT